MKRRKLRENKIYGLALIGLGGLTIPIDGNFTAFIVMLVLGGFLFFAKKNWIQ